MHVTHSLYVKDINFQQMLSRIQVSFLEKGTLIFNLLVFKKLKIFTKNIF
jgi:hypothetical protein